MTADELKQMIEAAFASKSDEDAQKVITAVTVETITKLADIAHHLDDIAWSLRHLTNRV